MTVPVQDDAGAAPADGIVICLSGHLIGGAEIAARFMNGSRELPPFLKSGGLVRQGSLGWDRQSVEQAFGEAASES